MEQTDDLWVRFKKDGDIEARNALLEQYVPLVKYVASKIAYTLPPHVDTDDLISYGTFGLMDAIEKFDPDKGFTFQTYGVSRIRGAILDELRSQDWVPRSVRSKAKTMDRAIQRLGAEFGRAPTDHEVATDLDYTIDQYYVAVRQVSNTSIAGLNDSVRNQEVENISIGDLITDEKSVVEDSLESEGLRKMVAGTISNMKDRERIVTALYYFEGLSLGEIGGVLGVTESRVCQIHGKALNDILGEAIGNRSLLRS